MNASGCLLIGVVMVIATRSAKQRRYVRPLLGVGVLGGFTTFSTFTLDAQRLLVARHPAVALSYVAATLTLGSLGVWIGTSLARQAAQWLAGRRSRAAAGTGSR